MLEEAHLQVCCMPMRWTALPQVMLNMSLSYGKIFSDWYSVLNVARWFQFFAYLIGFLVEFWIILKLFFPCHLKFLSYPQSVPLVEFMPLRSWQRSYGEVNGMRQASPNSNHTAFPSHGDTDCMFKYEYWDILTPIWHRKFQDVELQ